jgi:uncharacterized protein YciI
MSKQFVFFYLMKNDPDKMRKSVQEHIRYWKKSAPPSYSGGPFSDRSGGLILFEAESIEIARDLAMNDPFVVQEVTEDKWVKEWMPE